MLAGMKRLTNEDVIRRLRKEQNDRSLSQFARDIGVTKSFLSDVYLGKRGLGHKILTYLHLVPDPPTYSEVKE
jgi:transcriptional regulator with XRE-family HTH domain